MNLKATKAIYLLWCISVVFLSTEGMTERAHAGPSWLEKIKNSTPPMVPGLR
jgi:hypothetical protein